MNAKKAKAIRKWMKQRFGPKPAPVYELINHPKLVKQPDGSTAVMFVTQRVHREGSWMYLYKETKGLNK